MFSSTSHSYESFRCCSACHWIKLEQYHCYTIKTLSFPFYSKITQLIYFYPSTNFGNNFQLLFTYQYFLSQILNRPTVQAIIIWFSFLLISPSDRWEHNEICFSSHLLYSKYLLTSLPCPHLTVNIVSTREKVDCNFRI